MNIFNITKNIPTDKKFLFTDQIRISSSSVCADIAEAYRKKGILNILSENIVTGTLKIQKHKYAWIFHFL